MANKNFGILRPGILIRGLSDGTDRPWTPGLSDCDWIKFTSFRVYSSFIYILFVFKYETTLKYLDII